MAKEDRSLLEKICQGIFDKSGTNILTLDVHNFSTLADYYVIAEGNVEKHVQAIAKHLDDLMSEEGYEVGQIEGYFQGDWVVLDYGTIIVHLLIPAMRERYALEELWRQASIVNVPIKLHANSC